MVFLLFFVSRVFRVVLVLLMWFLVNSVWVIFSGFLLGSVGVFIWGLSRVWICDLGWVLVKLLIGWLFLNRIMVGRLWMLKCIMMFCLML